MLKFMRLKMNKVYLMVRFQLPDWWIMILR